jgi:RNA recognition motif-containing protein
MTVEQQKQKLEAKAGEHTNLFVESLPFIFTEKNVFDLFSLYGEVVSVKMKRPVLDLPALVAT